MKQIIIIITVFLSLGSLDKVYSQCAAADAGDMEATALSIKPSAPISACDLASVEAEWTNTSLFLNNLDNQCHLGTFNIALPPAFLGTTGTATIVASDGGLYFDTPICTDSQCDADILPNAVIPDGVTVSFVVANMIIDNTQSWVNQQVTSQIQWIAVDADGLNDDLTIASETTTNCGAISGLVFQDDFADGLNDANSGMDVELEGITVTLVDCGQDGICGNANDGATIVTTTDANGEYIFEDLPFSFFQVFFGTSTVTQTYDAFTVQDEGVDETIDSDADGTGVSPVIQISNADLTEEDVDAGLYEYIGILGTLFTDEDFSIPAPNVSTTITVTYADGTMITVPITTDGSGGFVIDDTAMLPPGTITDISSAFGEFEDTSVVNSSTDAPSGTVIMLQNFSLPVELSFFNVHKDGKEGVIVWQTVSEINSDYFEVLVSKDAINFELLGMAKSTGGLDRITDYKYVQTNPYSGVNYYKLRQVDLDGAYEYSAIKSLEFEIEENTYVRPNPTLGNAVFVIEASVQKEVRLELMDIRGKLIWKDTWNIESGENIYPLDLSALDAGTYLLVYNDNSVKRFERIVKID